MVNYYISYVLINSSSYYYFVSFSRQVIFPSFFFESLMVQCLNLSYLPYPLLLLHLITSRGCFNFKLVFFFRKSGLMCYKLNQHFISSNLIYLLIVIFFTAHRIFQLICLKFVYSLKQLIFLN